MTAVLRQPPGPTMSDQLPPAFKDLLERRAQEERHANRNRAKRLQRDEIERLTREYLAQGNEITVVEDGHSALTNDPVTRSREEQILIQKRIIRKPQR